MIRSTLAPLRQLQRATQRAHRCYTKIPEPTWSLNDLNLTSKSNQPIMNDKELDTLAQRCLLDVQSLSQEERHELKLELGNIMRCISLVCETTLVASTEEDLYDLPRGFDERSCPVRGEEMELNSWSEGVKKESEHVMVNLEHKTVRMKNEYGQDETFFSVMTKKVDDAENGQSP